MLTRCYFCAVPVSLLRREPRPAVRTVRIPCALDLRHRDWLHPGLSPAGPRFGRTLTEDYSETIYDLDVAQVHDVLIQLVGEVWLVEPGTATTCSQSNGRQSVTLHDSASALTTCHDAEQVIDNSVRATRAFVKQYLSDTIARAQSSIAAYGAQYSERMFAALTTCQQGAWRDVSRLPYYEYAV